MPDRRKNILLITTDQQRGDCLGIANGPPVLTPNIDAWLGQGTYFPRAYTEAPSCIPARRTLISGQSPYGHGMPGYIDGVPYDPPHTLMRSLRDVGYTTSCSGKMHFSPQRKNHGFGHMVLYEGMQRFGDYVDDYEEWLKARTTVHQHAHGVDSNSWMARPSHLPESLHVTNWTVDMAIEQLRRRDPDAPFFQWVSFHRPHAPLDPPQVYWDMYEGVDLPEPPLGEWSMEHAHPPPLEPNAWEGYLPERQQRMAQIGYYASITHVDAQIGRLLEEMRRLGAFKDTLVLLTADHGEMLGDHHLWRKTYAYEGSARVPFVVRFPSDSDMPTGLIHDNVVGLQDVMPTLLDLAGVAIPDTVEGRSLMPAMRGEGAEWREYLHGEHAACYSDDNAMQYLTDGKEKYVWFPPTGRERLFDLVADPMEMHDLVDDPDSAERVALWRRRMVEQLADRADGFSDGERLIERPFDILDYVGDERTVQ